jgi:hypothetical protein
MTNIELSLLMGFLPIIYFLSFTIMNRQFLVGQRIKTTALGRTGEVISIGSTHSVIEFDNGSVQVYRNSLFEVE